MLTVMGEVYAAAFPPEEYRYPTRSLGRPLLPLPTLELDLARVVLPPKVFAGVPSDGRSPSSSGPTEGLLVGHSVSFMPLQGITVRPACHLLCSSVLVYGGILVAFLVASNISCGIF
jgi:hypothetical protein